MKKTAKKNKKSTFKRAKSSMARLKQKAAIRKYYANKNADTVSVTLKMHRDKNGGHRHIIIEDIEDKHVSVGLTSQAKKGKNSTNYKCESDILGDGKQSYLRRQGIVDSISNYNDKISRRMTIKDYTQAKIYGERAKEKYFAKNKR